MIKNKLPKMTYGYKSKNMLTPKETEYVEDLIRWLSSLSSTIDEVSEYKPKIEEILLDKFTWKNKSHLKKRTDFIINKAIERKKEQKRKLDKISRSSQDRISEIIDSKSKKNY